jgi:hypothetical protein
VVEVKAPKLKRYGQWNGLVDDNRTRAGGAEPRIIKCLSNLLRERDISRFVYLFKQNETRVWFK